MKYLMIMPLLLSLLMTSCGKDKTTDAEPEPPYTVRLNNQCTEWNCVQFSFGEDYVRLYFFCNQGLHTVGTLFEEGNYRWSARVYNETPSDGLAMGSGFIDLNRDMTFIAADDTVYWE